MNNPRDHHYVPQCYLREFGNEQKLVCLNLLLTLKGINVKFSFMEPRQICYIKDYYKIIKTDYFDLNKYHENHIELNAFSKLENQYRKVIQNIITKQEVNLEDGLIICDFILNLKIRNPSFNKFIDHHKERNNEIAKKQLIENLMNDQRFKHYSYSFLKMLVDYFGDQ
ncbi:DUF4238 domain-containing protein [Algoriphagus lacus]|uniref:DUF4238 domain-containing protein n=1 Tax=Algoriphagus lacus TaxID=2056311 RepID=A0A418PM25_9BACT|nr:DUF4238 domain-containing protein [Algoriphagus lacus]RIW12597.1 DUF4238 domain-containing protein [Algoriphagus lacus]